MSRGFCRASQALALLGLLGIHQAAWAVVTLPLEVIGADGTTVSCTVDVPAGTSGQVRGLWMQIHGLTYANKASVQINSAPWVPLNNATVQVAAPGKNFGGIGGAFSTLKMVLNLPSGQVVDGPNTVRFRMNHTDGVSIGFRVLAFNFLTSSGAQILAASTFVQEDPRAWRPPYTDLASIAAGQKLWRTAVLTASTLPGAGTLQARCADCHAQDGRDLKYFNYSNRAIIERSKFHGLTPTEGAKIASYIRSLSAPNPGRPWNPPYQPGPGLDAKPVTSWAAGAGIAWVLDRDRDTLRYLFPNGISEDAIRTDKTLNVREIPIALPLPDWNHWLPKIHPKDAWGEAFTNSDLLKMYAGEGGGTANWNLRGRLSQRNAPLYIFNGLYSPLKNNLQTWSMARHLFLQPKTEPQDQQPWSPLYSRKVYSTALWQLVKLWELMQEFNLEDYSSILFPGSNEARTWFADIPWQTAPHKLKIPISENGIDGDPLKTVYLSSAWYHLQVVLYNGNRKHITINPVDWPYIYGHLGSLNRLSGAPEAMRLTLSMVKAMQNSDDGIGPEDTSRGWDPFRFADVSRLSGDPWAPLWKDTPADVRAHVMQAVLEAWFDKMREYTPQQYYSGHVADPSEAIDGNMNGSVGNRIYYAIPRFRGAGVDDALLDRIADWAKTVWPKGNWDQLKTANSSPAPTPSDSASGTTGSGPSASPS
jgi:hypothetical protein